MHWIWRSILISSTISAGIFLFVFYSETGALPLMDENWVGLSLALLLGNLVGAGMFRLNLSFNKILPWNRHITGRFIMEVFSGFLLVTLAAMIYIYGFVDQIVETDLLDSFWEEYWDGVVKFGIVSLVIIYLFSLVNFSIFSYNQYAVQQIRTLSLERQQLNLQFEALKSQLSPHFLFNSLNTISSLIYKDLHLAENFIRQLAHTYTYILGNDETKLVKLKIEMEMMQSFFEMQKTRYGDALSLKIDVPEEIKQTYIPPLTLQMLLENALKHNLVEDDNPLHLRLFFMSKEDMLVLQNNHIPRPELIRIGNSLVDRPKNGNSHKIGLSNIRKRYAYFTNRQPAVIFEKDFIVKLPIIEKNVE
ncbi:MAG: histidine kinase [Bacteroidetes bacterium]|nr:histidine kinase [Bacteroidota bacterium]